MKQLTKAQEEAKALLTDTWQQASDLPSVSENTLEDLAELGIAKIKSVNFYQLKLPRGNPIV